MCMEDIRVMRRTYSSERTFNTGGQSSPLVIVPRNESRVYLEIRCLIAVDHNIMFNRQSSDDILGLALANNQSLIFDVQKSGQLCMGPWYFIGDDMILTIMETFLEER